jgi:hypothetical protein
MPGGAEAERGIRNEGRGVTTRTEDVQGTLVRLRYKGRLYSFFSFQPDVVFDLEQLQKSIDEGRVPCQADDNNVDDHK